VNYFWFESMKKNAEWFHLCSQDTLQKSHKVFTLKICGHISDHKNMLKVDHCLQRLQVHIVNREMLSFEEM
jgi:hypothetical protein